MIFDIEGTTTSISFVADTLFPFIRNKLLAHLEANFGSEQLQEDLALLRFVSTTYI
jgi:methylthioribulose 1-phosphate dehydratase/enolase-phosphatase E1